MGVAATFSESESLVYKGAYEEMQICSFIEKHFASRQDSKRSPKVECRVRDTTKKHTGQSTQRQKTRTQKSGPFGKRQIVNYNYVVAVEETHDSFSHQNSKAFGV